MGTAANELTSSAATGCGTTGYTYDAWGRLIGKTYTDVDGTKATQYAYRYGDKLTQVAQNWPGGNTVNYEYRGDGTRLYRAEGTDILYYHWDAGWNVINESDNAAALTASYIYGPTGLLADISVATGAWRYYEQDRLGSTRRMRNNDATALNYINYSPYGKILTPNLTNVKYTFTGKEFDPATNLYYFPYRYYSPSMGSRWLTRDPLGMVDGPNLYGYVRANPITYSDLLGFGIYVQFFWRPNPPLPSLPPVRGTNPYQHCVYSCRAAHKYGQSISEWGGLLKEYADWFGCMRTGDPSLCYSAFQESDFLDNATGRNCARDNPGNIQSCEKCCSDRGVGCDTPEGPGEDRPYGPYWPEAGTSVWDYLRF